MSKEENGFCFVCAREDPEEIEEEEEEEEEGGEEEGGEEEKKQVNWVCFQKKLLKLLKNYKTTLIFFQVGCMQCNRYYHQFCIQIENKDNDYICSMCT